MNLKGTNAVIKPARFLKGAKSCKVTLLNTQEVAIEVFPIYYCAYSTKNVAVPRSTLINGLLAPQASRLKIGVNAESLRVLLDRPYISTMVDKLDLQLASLACGFSLGFGFLTVWEAIKQTRRNQNARRSLYVSSKFITLRSLDDPCHVSTLFLF